MDSQYDFKNLERELSSIEQQLKSFEKSLDSTVEPILSAKFNDREYGERAVEGKIDEIIYDSKRRIERKYNEYLNGVKRASYDSTERIKREAMAVSQRIERLNDSLNQWVKLNQAFASKDFRCVIKNAESFDTSLFDKELNDSLLYIKLESYDGLCKEEIANISVENYGDYFAYFSLCKSNEAGKHLIHSATYLLHASSIVISLSGLDQRQLYGYCRNGLEAYKVMPDAEKIKLQFAYQKCYSNGIRIYNDLCGKAYGSFDYTLVKSLLNDSKMFAPADIKEGFFQSGKTDAKTLFDYYRNKGHNAPIEIVDMVFDDTKSLIDTSEKERYISYWMTRYDNHRLRYVEKIVNGEENKLPVFSTLLTALLENGTAIVRGAECLTDMATFYNSILISRKEGINLRLFLKNAILWNKYIKQVQSCTTSENKDNYNNGAMIIDGITYPMINKYKKLCNGFDRELVNELNAVMDATSIRLFGKRYTKNLKCSEENSTPKSTTVKLITMEIKAKKRKKLILGGVITAVVIVAIVLIVILCR